MTVCKNGIARIRVRAANGNNSKLFSDIMEVMNNRDEALRVYAFVNSDHYKEVAESKKKDENGEPLIDDVFTTIDLHFSDHNSPKRITKDTPGATKGEQQYDETSVNYRLQRRARDIKAKKYSSIKETYKQISVAKLNNNKAEEHQLYKRIASLQVDIMNIDDEMDAHATLAYAERDLAKAFAILNKRTMEPHDIIYLKSTANTWTNVVDDFFPESDRSTWLVKGGNTDNGFFPGFNVVMGDAFTLLRRIENLEVQYLNDALSKETGKEIDIEKTFHEQRDYTGIHAQTMSINRTDNIMFQAVSDINFKLMSQAKQEFRDFEESFDDVLDKALPELRKASNTKNPYDLFREVYRDGKETGDLMRQFRPEYDDAEAVHFKEAIDENSVESMNNYYKWFDDNNVLMDWRILFSGERDEEGDLIYSEEEFNEADRQKLKDEIVALVGEDEYARMYTLSKRNFEDFKELRQLQKDDIGTRRDLQTMEEKLDVLDKWDKVYSPFYYAQVVNSHETYYTDEGAIPAKGHANTVVIPRKNDKSTGAETGWYNEDFNKIRDNKVIYDFYNVMLNTLHDLNVMLPHNVAKNLKDNSIPNLRRSVIDAWFQEGGKAAKKEVMERLIRSMTADNSSDLAFAEVDPYTNEISKSLTINIVKQNNDRINKIYSQKLIQFELDNNKKANTEEKRELKREAVDEVVQDKSFDLGEVIKVYFLTTQMYAKKAQIEDLVRISDSVFKNQREVERTSDGRVKANNSGRISYKEEGESFKNIRSQWDYWTDYFYGYRSQVEGLSSKKLLTKEQQAEKDKLDQLKVDLEAAFEAGKIDMEEYTAKKNKIDRQVVELGGNISSGKTGRALLKFVQLKAMGWNLFSGITNMSFGWIANIEEANYGLVYNKKDLGWALKKSFGSILKNYTFNMVESPDAKKIRALTERLDILSETSNEIYQRTYKSSSHKPFEWLKPFNIQNRTEYFNQAPVMLAIMHNTYFNTSKGKVMAYECFDENGKWLTEELGPEPKSEVGDFQVKVATSIARIHGNYNSEMPILANKKVWTTMLKQFRTWMFEGFADRFQREQYSKALGIDISGRYRPEHGGFLFFNWAKTAEQHEKGTPLGFSDVVQNTGFTIVQLLRKLSFQSTKFEEKFTESDAANLRKNLSEFVILVQLTAFLLLLSMMGGDDDDTVADMYAKNYLLNLLGRVQDDILYYVSPTSFEQLTKQSVPAMSLITDAGKLIEASVQSAMGNGKISRGVYAGEHKLMRAINRNVPMLNKIQANRGAMKQVYNDITFSK